MEMRQSSRSRNSSGDNCPVSGEGLDAASAVGGGGVPCVFVAFGGVGVPCVFVASGGANKNDESPNMNVTVVKIRRVFGIPLRGELEIFISVSSQLFKLIGTVNGGVDS